MGIKEQIEALTTEALARGRGPRKLWPVLHAIEEATTSTAEWVQKARKDSSSRLAEDKQLRRCGCHICAVDS